MPIFCDDRVSHQLMGDWASETREKVFFVDCGGVHEVFQGRTSGLVSFLLEFFFEGGATEAMTRRGFNLRRTDEERKTER